MTYSRLLHYCLSLATGLLFSVLSIGAHGQTLEAEVVRNPNDTVTYTIDLDGPPRGTSLLFLSPLPLLKDPLLQNFRLPLRWIGTFSVLNITPQNPAPPPELLFDFNFQLQLVETPDFSQIIISDGLEEVNGINPGVTCRDLNGCGPINFSFPFEPVQFPSIAALPNDTSLFVDVQLHDFSTDFQGSDASLGLNFIDPLHPYFQQINLLDAALIPPNPLPTTLLFPPDPLLDPLALGGNSLPIPPVPSLAGLELHTQALVLDPAPLLAPTLSFFDLQGGQNVRIGNSMVITVREVPAPATIGLLGAGLLLLRRKSRRS